MLSRHVFLTAVLLAFALPACAETQAVRFAPGKTSTVLKGEIEGRQSVSYTFGAEAGQRVLIALKAASNAASFNLYEPGRKPGDAALAVGELTDKRFEGELPASGTYTIDLFLNRAAARRGEVSAYSLAISITPKIDLNTRVKADYADGLQGGPDYWRVIGGPLVLRETPSQGARSLARIADRAVLKNQGCRMAEGGRWCKVSPVNDPAATGWVRGERLRENGAPSSDARVAGTPYHATGVIPCAVYLGQPTNACKFGVVRQEQGRASVTIFLPGGGERIIRFEKGQPVGSDAPDGARLTFTQEGGLFLIRIGTARFEIPDAAVSGG